MASKEDVLAVKGVLDRALYGPGGIVDSLSDERRRRFEQGYIYVDSFPTAEERASVAAPWPDYLFGRYLDLSDDPAGPWQLQVYADEVKRHGGIDPVDVLTHELGHAWGFHHGEHCPSCSAAERQQRQHVHSDVCPVCNLHSETAVAMGLLAGLKTRANVEHVIPLGLGGTIPEARIHLARAANLIPAARTAGADPGQLATLRQRLADAQEALAGWVTVQQLAAASAATTLAWDAAYDVNHSFWTPQGSRVAACSIPAS